MQFEHIQIKSFNENVSFSNIFFYSLSFYDDDDDDLACYKNIFYILFYIKKLYILCFEFKYKLEISRDSRMPLTQNQLLL